MHIIDPVDKTQIILQYSPPTQHHSFFRNLPPLLVVYLMLSLISSPVLVSEMSSFYVAKILSRHVGFCRSFLSREYNGCLIFLFINKNK